MQTEKTDNKKLQPIFQKKDIGDIIWNQNGGFEFDSLTFDNDFVILKLGSPLQFNNETQPACLPSSPGYLSLDSTEDRCFTSGWGQLESDRHLCFKHCKVARLRISDSMFVLLTNHTKMYISVQKT